MSWHLKNKALEKKLIAIDPDFVGNLQKSVKYHEDETTVAVGFGDGIGGLSRFVAEFRWDELEGAPKYNPKAWNKFPQVIPPENVRMRVEFNYKDEPEKTYHACFYFFSGKWYWDTCKYSIASSIVNIRFRPWEG